jgi:hypothetical protein
MCDFFGHNLCGCFVPTENLIKYLPITVGKRFLKIGQQTKVDPLSLPKQSQESKYVEGVTLDKEMEGRTERIRNSEAKEDRSQGVSKRAVMESEGDIESRHYV